MVPHRLSALFVDTPTAGQVTFPDYGTFQAKVGANHLKVHDRLAPGKELTFAGPPGATAHALVEASWDNPVNFGSNELR